MIMFNTRVKAECYTRNDLPANFLVKVVSSAPRIHFSNNQFQTFPLS